MFKADFEAERTAREEMASERDKLKEAIDQLQLRNQQLLEEMQSMSATQVSELQRRHGYLAYTQVLTSTFLTGYSRVNNNFRSVGQTENFEEKTVLLYDRKRRTARGVTNNGLVTSRGRWGQGPREEPHCIVTIECP